MGDVSDARCNVTSSTGASQTSEENILCSKRVLFKYTHKGAGMHCSLYQFISNSERNYVHAMSWLCRQLRHEVTKKAIKAALKLCACMQYVIYASHLRTCL